MDKYIKEFNQLVEEFGQQKVYSLFSSGFEGFKHSRIFGNYSIDAIKQTLK